MKTTFTTLLITAALTGSAWAQTAPVGGPEAKGNAPVKHAHTVNDGAAKPGANSFTRAQAMRHIEHSGYTGVTGLTKGSDGVWRGMAMKGGASVNVAMDFKGNVTQGMAPTAATPEPMAAPAPAASAMASPPAVASDMAPASGASRHHHRRHHRRHHHHHHGGAGVGMSGVDRNKNGISDKEDRALKH